MFCYFSFLGNSATSTATIATASAAIRHFHRLQGIQDDATPTHDPLVVDLVKSLTKKIGLLVRNRKEPLHRDELVQICSTYLPTALVDVNALQTLTYLAVSYAGALRYNEAAALTPADINLCTDHAAIFIAKRKNDQFREGNVLYLARGTSAACPVALLTHLLPHCPAANQPLFRHLNGKRYSLSSPTTPPTAASDHRAASPLDSDQARRLIRRILSICLQTPEDQLPSFGTHSLRSGCATDIMASSMISDRELKRHGGWRSDVYMRYIKDSLPKLLAATRALNL